MSHDLRWRQPDGSYVDMPQRPDPDPRDIKHALIPFTLDDLERLERVNDALVDGFAGEAGVQLGELLDDIERRAKLWQAGRQSV